MITYTPLLIFSILIVVYLVIGLAMLFAFWLSWDESIPKEVIIVTLLLWPYLWLNTPIDWKVIKTKWRLGLKIWLALIAVWVIALFIWSFI